MRCSSASQVVLLTSLSNGTAGGSGGGALGADACEIRTDVDGVYTADPNVCAQARKIDRITYEEMLELASLGAKVLQRRSVEVAMKYEVPLHVRSSFSDAPVPSCHPPAPGSMATSKDEASLAPDR